MGVIGVAAGAGMQVGSFYSAAATRNSKEVILGLKFLRRHAGRLESSKSSWLFGWHLGARPALYN